MKNKMKIGWSALVMAFLMLACGGNDSANEEMTIDFIGAMEELDLDMIEQEMDAGDAMSMDEVSPSSNIPIEDDDLKIQIKLIKNADLRFETDDLFARKEIVHKSVEAFNGYVENEQQDSYIGEETVYMTIRIPVNNFDAFIAEATAGVGRFDSKIISVDDATEEYVDLEARIKTKKTLKQRYHKLLDEAKTVYEIMDVENQIVKLQADIESYEARLNVLKSTTRMATINMTFYRELEVSNEFDNQFTAAFSNGWNGLVWFLVGLTTLWPFIIIGTGLFFFVRYRVRKAK